MEGSGTAWYLFSGAINAYAAKAVILVLFANALVVLKLIWPMLPIQKYIRDLSVEAVVNFCCDCGASSLDLGERPSREQKRDMKDV